MMRVQHLNNTDLQWFLLEMSQSSHLIEWWELPCPVVDESALCNLFLGDMVRLEESLDFWEMEAKEQDGRRREFLNLFGGFSVVDEERKIMPEEEYNYMEICSDPD